ncbi:cupredoxin domain-containing protein [Bacillus kwashiorkori]|uniref:cupredoxin domain-containing protein n=1 Tax=Bacillus kwashiorkori TaxID=1522318 RepID=UPI0007810CE5|nr:cupredoxin domain-containing protein [Bacillus kwashiorkori]
MNFIVIKRNNVFKWVVVIFIITSAIIWYSFQAKALTVFQADKTNYREIHMVTGEFATKTAEGKEIEAYRWDPGTIVLRKDEKVHLKIFGVNGQEHPFYIEGTDIQGTVQKGKETTIPLQFNKTGTYRLICITHPDAEHNGPMIAYIVVID